MDPFIVKLDRERELKYSFRSIAELGRKCKVNVNDGATFKLPLSPDLISALIWAGQLHEKDALSLEKVETYLTPAYASNVELMPKVVLAIMDALGLVKPEKESGSV